MKRHLYQPDSASIGLFTLDEVRVQGVGRGIIRALILRCLAQGLEPVG